MNKSWREKNRQGREKYRKIKIGGERERKVKKELNTGGERGRIKRRLRNERMKKKRETKTDKEGKCRHEHMRHIRNKSRKNI
jgi:hypothetical protein